MREKVQKGISLCLALVLCVLCFPGEVSAAEYVEHCQMKRVYTVPVYENTELTWAVVDSQGNAKATVPYITNCFTDRDDTSEGMKLTFTTICSNMSEEVGVKDVKVEKKVGIFWSTVATSEGGSCADASTYRGSLLFTGAEYGSTYRVSCVHFAYCGGYDLQQEGGCEAKKFTY